MLDGLVKRVGEEFIDMISNEFEDLKFVKVKEEDESGIVWLTISRSEVLNALNHELLVELLDTLTQLHNSDSLRVLVITGAGEKAFVAGADIAAMKELTPSEALEFATLGQSCFSLIEQFPRPVIASVNGFALGGGLELALSCDFIIASDTAKFGQPEVKLGLIPGFGGTQRLMREIGMRKAKDLIFSGRIINAADALRIGLVTRVVPADSLTSEVNKVAKEIASQSPFAISTAKRTMNEGSDSNLESGLLMERQSFALCFDTQDQVEGCSAFIEKRTPSFTGQ